MALRKSLRETQLPSKALFFFSDENMTGIGPTKIILEKEKAVLGETVSVNWQGKTVKGRIIGLSDSMEELNRRDLSWSEENLKKANPESEEPQKKRKRSGKKTSSGKAAKASKAKEVCTVIVSGEPSSEAANYTEDKDYSYDEANAIVSIPVPASPSVSVRTSTPPASPSGQPFIDDLFDLNEEVSVNQKLDKIMENQKVLLKLFSDHIQQRRDSVCHCQCKAGRDQIRIGRRESSGIFSDVGSKKGGSVTLSSEISARAASVFPNTSTEGDDFFNTRSVNCGLQREDSSKRVVSGCSNTIIGEGEFLNTSSVDGGTEILGGLSSFSLVSGEDVIDTGEEVDVFLREAVKLKSKSCSVGNFSQKLVQLVFQPEELLNRNCTGTRGKQALDQVKLGVVKSYVYKLYPCAKSREDAQWRKCITCIDEFLRRKKKDTRVD